MEVKLLLLFLAPIIFLQYLFGEDSNEVDPEKIESSQLFESARNSRFVITLSLSFVYVWLRRQTKWVRSLCIACGI